MIGFNSNPNINQIKLDSNVKITTSFFKEMQEMSSTRKRSSSDVPRFKCSAKELLSAKLNPVFGDHLPLPEQCGMSQTRTQVPSRCSDFSQSHKFKGVQESLIGNQSIFAQNEERSHSLLGFRKMVSRDRQKPSRVLEADALSFDGESQQQDLFGFKKINFGLGSLNDIKNSYPAKSYASMRFCESPITRASGKHSFSPFYAESKGLTKSPCENRSFMTIGSPEPKKRLNRESIFIQSNFDSQTISHCDPEKNIFFNDSDSVKTPLSHRKSRIGKNCFYDSEDEENEKNAFKMAGGNKGSFSTVFSNRGRIKHLNDQMKISKVRSSSQIKKESNANLRRMQLMFKTPLSGSTGRGLLVSRPSSVFNLDSSYQSQVDLAKPRLSRKFSQRSLPILCKRGFSANLLNADLNFGPKPGSLFKKFCQQKGILKSMMLLDKSKIECNQPLDPPLAFFNLSKNSHWERKKRSQNQRNGNFIKRQSYSAKKSKSLNCFKKSAFSIQPVQKKSKRVFEDAKKVEDSELDKIKKLHSQIKSNLLFENEFDKKSAILFVQKFREFVSKSTTERGRSVNGGKVKRVKRC